MPLDIFAGINQSFFFSFFFPAHAFFFCCSGKADGLEVESIS